MKRLILAPNLHVPIDACTQTFAWIGRKGSGKTYGAGGLVRGNSHSVEITDTGMAALGPNYQPLPTGTALRDHWMDKLPEGERRILEWCVKAYPKYIARDELSDQTGYKRSSRDTYLQRLSARRLVTFPQNGFVLASDMLF